MRWVSFYFPLKLCKWNCIPFVVTKFPEETFPIVKVQADFSDTKHQGTFASAVWDGCIGVPFTLMQM